MENHIVIDRSSSGDDYTSNHEDILYIFSFSLYYFWNIILLLGVARKNLNLLKFFLEKINNGYQNFIEISEILESFLIKVIHLTNCFKEIIKRYGILVTFDVYFVRTIIVFERQYVLISYIKTKFGNITFHFQNFLNQFVRCSKIGDLVQIVFHVDSSFNEILDKYLGITNSYGDISVDFLKFLNSLDFSKVFNFNPILRNDLKSLLDGVILLNSILEKFTSVYENCKYIWCLLQPSIYFLLNLKVLHVFFCNLELVLNVSKAISEILNKIFNSLKDLISDERPFIPKSLGEILDTTNILEIIFESTDWMQVSRMAIDCLKSYDSIFGKFFLLYDETGELCNIFESFSDKCIEIFGNFTELFNYFVNIGE